MTAQSLPGAQEDERRVGDSAVAEKLGVLEKLLVGQGIQGGVAGILSPQVAEESDGSRVEVVEGGVGADLGGEVGSCFGEDRPQPIRGHGREAVPGAHPVGPFVLNRHPEGTRRHGEDQHAAVGMLELVRVDPQVEPLDEPGFGPLPLYDALEPAATLATGLTRTHRGESP